MTAQIIPFPQKIGSDYFKPTVTASTNLDYTPRPYAISARMKRETLLNSGWSVYDGETVVVYSHPKVWNNSSFFLEDAWELQCERELQGRDVS